MLTFNKIFLDTFLNMLNKNAFVFKLDLCIIYSGKNPSPLTKF